MGFLHKKYIFAVKESSVLERKTPFSRLEFLKWDLQDNLIIELMDEKGKIIFNAA